MKNLLPVTKVPFEKERTFSGCTSERPKAPPQPETHRGFSHGLLSQFLHRMSAAEKVQVSVSEFRSSQIDEQAIRQVAYFRYLDRLEKGIHSSAEDDWKYAEETLKKQNSRGAN